MVGPVLNLDPAAELATRRIVAGGPLANWTLNEVMAFIGQIKDFAEGIPVGGTIEQTTTNISTEVQPWINVVLPALATSGQATPPSAFGGTYNIVEFFGNLGINIQREIFSGTVTVNANGTFSGTVAGNNVAQAESCVAPQTFPCGRTFTRTISPQSDSFSGTYVYLGNGLIFFTTAEEGGGTDSVLGAMDPTGTILVVPEGGSTAGFSLAVKAGSGTVAGTFQTTELLSQIPATFSATSVWQGVASEMTFGTVTVTGSNFAANLTSSRMQQSFSCLESSGSCSLTATVSSTESVDTPSGTMAAGPAAGQVTFTTAEGSVPGAVSPDGNILWIKTGDGSEGEPGVLVAIHEGSGMSNASLNGAYNVTGFTHQLTGGNNPSASDGTILGVVTFDGAGGWSFGGVDTKNIRGTSCSTTSCPSTALSRSSSGDTSSGTYSVNANGTFTMTSTSGTDLSTLQGMVSPDGNVVGLRDVSSAQGEHLLIFALKQ